MDSIIQKQPVLNRSISTKKKSYKKFKIVPPNFIYGVGIYI